MMSRHHAAVPVEYAGLTNPVPPDATSLERGANLHATNCASCHGKDGKPVKAGARDFRRTEQMKLYSDAQWFWRVSEGVKGTKMKAWKTKLSEDERWKVIAYEATFGLKGQEYDVAANKWVPQGTAGKAAPEAAPEAEPAGGGEAH